MENSMEHNGSIGLIASMRQQEAKSYYNLPRPGNSIMGSDDQEHSGFTPFIKQEARFGTFTSAKSSFSSCSPSSPISTTSTISPFSSEKPSSLLSFDNKSTSIACLPAGDKVFGLRLLANDFGLRSTRVHSLGTNFNPGPEPVENEPKPKVLKKFKTELVKTKAKSKISKKVKAEPVDTEPKPKLSQEVKVGPLVTKTKILFYQMKLLGDGKSIRLSLPNFTPIGFQTRALPVAERQSDQLNGPCKTFTVFKKLPAELRLKVWRYATPADRVVNIIITGSQKGLEDEYRAQKMPVPTVLRICHESREEGLKFLKPMFSTVAGVGQYVYFDPKTDVLKLNLKDAQIFARLKDPGFVADREQVRHLECTGAIRPATFNMAEAVATLILKAKYVAWPAMESIFFSGGADNKHKYKLGFSVKMPAEEEESNHLKDTFEPMIEKGFLLATAKYGTKANISFMCRYE